MTKSFALGADMVASARSILMVLQKEGLKQAIDFILNLFENVKKIMYLTGCHNIEDLKRIKLINKRDLH